MSESSGSDLENLSNSEQKEDNRNKLFKFSRSDPTDKIKIHEKR